MEKDLNELVKEYFALEDRDIRSYSPLTLAYIGDGIFDVIVRSLVVDEGNTAVNRMHRRTSSVVKAASQSRMAQAIAPMLTAEEADILRRGRNAKPHTMAKNASVSDYRSATGFESLMGYLYLTKQTERMLELVREAMMRCGFWKGGDKPV